MVEGCRRGSERVEVRRAGGGGAGHAAVDRKHSPGAQVSRSPRFPAVLEGVWPPAPTSVILLP